MKKLVLLLLLLFSFGFTFPKDIGLINKDDLESTKSNLLQYLNLEDNLKYNDIYSAFTDESLFLYVDKDKKTLTGVAINNLSASQAEQLLLDIGIGINNTVKAVLLGNKPIVAHTLIIEDKVVLFQNLEGISWVDQKKPFKISIAFTEAMAEDYLERELMEIQAYQLFKSE